MSESFPVVFAPKKPLKLPSALNCSMPSLVPSLTTKMVPKSLTATFLGLYGLEP